MDVSTTNSRRGLLYFGFPLQRDRLDHDKVNAGLTWKSMLGNSDDSTLNTTLGFNQDYFSTYGPTQNTFYRTGKLNSRALNARIDRTAFCLLQARNRRKPPITKRRPSAFSSPEN